MELNEILLNYVNSCKADNYYFNSFYLLFNLGIRHNELYLQNWKLINNLYLLSCSKNSVTRAFAPSTLPAFFKYAIEYQQYNYIYAYSTLYRYFEKKSIYQFITSEKHNLAMHIFRHNYIKKIFDKYTELDTILALTGEKSLSTINYCVNSEIQIKQK